MSDLILVVIVAIKDFGFITISKKLNIWSKLLCWLLIDSI